MRSIYALILASLCKTCENFNFRMCKKMGKVKQINDALSEKNDDMEDRIRKLQSKLDQYVNISNIIM